MPGTLLTPRSLAAVNVNRGASCTSSSSPLLFASVRLDSRKMPRCSRGANPFPDARPPTFCYVGIEVNGQLKLENDALKTISKLGGAKDLGSWMRAKEGGAAAREKAGRLW